MLKFTGNNGFTTDQLNLFIKMGRFYEAKGNIYAFKLLNAIQERGDIQALRMLSNPVYPLQAEKRLRPDYDRFFKNNRNSEEAVFNGLVSINEDLRFGRHGKLKAIQAILNQEAN